jgi:hypothetical protein
VKLFKRKPLEKPFPEKLARRVTRIPTADLASWAEQSLNEISRCVSKYQSTQEQLYLDEALKGAEALNAVISELHKRCTI